MHRLGFCSSFTGDCSVLSAQEEARTSSNQVAPADAMTGAPAVLPLDVVSLRLQIAASLAAVGRVTTTGGERRTTKCNGNRFPASPGEGTEPSGVAGSLTDEECNSSSACGVRAKEGLIVLELADRPMGDQAPALPVRVCIPVLKWGLGRRRRGGRAWRREAGEAHARSRTASGFEDKDSASDTLAAAEQRSCMAAKRSVLLAWSAEASVALASRASRARRSVRLAVQFASA